MSDMRAPRLTRQLVPILLVALVALAATCHAAGLLNNEPAGPAPKHLERLFKDRGAAQTGVVDMLNAPMNQAKWMEMARKQCVMACRSKKATKPDHYSAGASGLGLEPMPNNRWACGCVDKPIYESN